MRASDTCARRSSAAAMLFAYNQGESERIAY
jgi:hypothetical protein